MSEQNEIGKKKKSYDICTADMNERENKLCVCVCYCGVCDVKSNLTTLDLFKTRNFEALLLHIVGYSILTRSCHNCPTSGTAGITLWWGGCNKNHVFITLL